MLRKYFWIFVKTEKVLEKILACIGVLKIQICSGENVIWDKYRFTFGKGSSFWVWRAGPFSCTDLPLFGSSWRSGRGRTLNLTPHLLWSSSFGSGGHRCWRSLTTNSDRQLLHKKEPKCGINARIDLFINRFYRWCSRMCVGDFEHFAA